MKIFQQGLNQVHSMWMSIATNEDNFLTELSSSPRPYRIPQMHLSSEILMSVLGDISLFFMGIRTKFGVHQAVAILESHEQHLPSGPLILEFSRHFFLFSPRTVFANFLFGS